MACLHNDNLGGHVAKGAADSDVAPPTFHRTREIRMREFHKEDERKRRLIARARKGGLALLAKRGRDHFVNIGKLGGRPTWQQALEKAKSSTPKGGQGRDR